MATVKEEVKEEEVKKNEITSNLYQLELLDLMDENNENLTTLMATSKLEEGYWDESPVSEKDLDTYFKYEEGYISEHLNDAKRLFNENDNITQFKGSVKLPREREAKIALHRNKDIYNKKECKITKGSKATFIIENSNNVYRDILKDMFEED